MCQTQGGCRPRFSPFPLLPLIASCWLTHYLGEPVEGDERQQWWQMLGGMGVHALPIAMVEMGGAEMLIPPLLLLLPLTATHWLGHPMGIHPSRRWRTAVLDVCGIWHQLHDSPRALLGSLRLPLYRYCQPLEFY